MKLNPILISLATTILWAIIVIFILLSTLNYNESNGMLVIIATTMPTVGLLSFVIAAICQYKWVSRNFLITISCLLIWMVFFILTFMNGIAGFFYILAYIY